MSKTLVKRQKICFLFTFLLFRLDSSFSHSMSITEMCMDDLSKCCRLCMKIAKNLRSIFNYKHKKWNVSDMSKVILDCTNIKVSTDITTFYTIPISFGDIQNNFFFVIWLKVTVDDSTTGICVLCYKQIMSINNFRERCALANEQFIKRCKQNTKSDSLLEEEECIPFVDTGEEFIPSLTKDSHFSDTGQLFIEHC